MESICNYKLTRLKLNIMENNYIKLYNNTSIIINGLKTLLESKNILYIIKDRFESARLGGFGEHMNSVELHVLNSDKEAAEKILSEYKEKINS